MLQLPPSKAKKEKDLNLENIDEKEFSFEEPAIAPTENSSIEEDEKSLINALSFTKKVETEIKLGSINMPL